MTVIIGSLFLPYTVQFEVGAQSELESDLLSASQDQTPSNSSQPVLIRQNSILPSLSSAGSYKGSTASSPKNADDIIRRKSVTEGGKSIEEFFLLRSGKNKPVTNSNQLLAEKLTQKLSSQYIQPKSRVSKPIDSSVVEPKRKSEDLGIPTLKMNRSSTNLSALSSAHSSSSASLAPPNAFNARANAALSRSALSMSLNAGSTGSLNEPIPENNHYEIDSDTDDWENDFNEMINPRTTTRLAPFGGFSHPDIEENIANQANIFETAPWKVAFAAKGNGTLIKAVKQAANQGIIHNRRWVGTVGMPTDSVPQHVIDDIAKGLSTEYHSEAVFPSDITFNGHYHSFCKQVLWPTLHYEIPDNPKSKVFEDHSWGHFVELNQLIADRIVHIYREENSHSDPEDPENMIWIHDYHLLLVPDMIRKQLPEAKIGFFLHVSFPSSEVFRCLAQRTALLKGMLGANAISFQSDEYVRHFLQTSSRLLLADTNEFGITFEDRFIMVNTIPAGIQANSLAEVLSSDDVTEWRDKIRERWRDQRLIVSRDKLDKLRGIKEKFLAYEKFLKTNPSFIDTTVLIQVCIGDSGGEDDYVSEVMSIVSRINALADNISISQPVVLLQHDIGFEQYLALQTEADVFVVSSMREGMNLTCHEFIVATTEKKSPLMLSEFTGSSQLLECHGKGALLINPWDIKSFSEIFLQSLTLSPNEKLERWRNCFDLVTSHDSMHWVQGCLSTINEAWDFDRQRSSCKLRPFTKEVLQNFYTRTANGRKLIILNLETPSAVASLADKKQTFTSYSNVPAARKGLNIQEPSAVAQLLSGLLSDPDCDVYIISYYEKSTLDTLFKRIPRLGLIAENGGYIKTVGSKEWISIVDEKELEKWMPQVVQLIDAKVERLPGSRRQLEDCTALFHPGKAFIEDKERALDFMGDCIQHVNELFHDVGVHAALIRNSIVVQQNKLSSKAIKFLIAYYNNESVEGIKPRTVPASNPVSPAQESFAELKPSGRVSGVFMGGGSTLVDEPNYLLAEELKKDHKIQEVLTVAALTTGKSNTSAQFMVSGNNEMLGILSSSNLH